MSQAAEIQKEAEALQPKKQTKKEKIGSIEENRAKEKQRLKTIAEESQPVQGPPPTTETPAPSFDNVEETAQQKSLRLYREKIKKGVK